MPKHRCGRQHTDGVINENPAPARLLRSAAGWQRVSDECVFTLALIAVIAATPSIAISRYPMAQVAT
jgi:hypothetical protein